MIKKIIIRKIMIATIAFFAIGIFCFIPKENNKLKDIKQEIEYVDIEIKMHDIFLLDINSYVSLTKVVIENNDTIKLAKELLEILIIDGKGSSKIPNGFKSVIPADTVINNITYKDNVLKVDFSKELLNVDKQLEERVIESIVFTLTSINNVDKVIIYIDGEILTRLPKSDKVLPSSFDRSYGVNKVYDINYIKDVIGVIIYYINEHNGNYYYVPVTTYLNDNRDKISIIIDELSNNFVHVDNLMSFLKQDVELISVMQNNKTMVLKFNDAIFNSIEEKTILEEVIYTISLSIGDNYDVNEVIFNVENEEIFKKSIE